MNTRAWIGKALRRSADRIDHRGAPRSIDWSFTFERGQGIVFHNNRKAGCPLYYLGMDDYDRAHREETPSPQLMALYDRIREDSRAAETDSPNTVLEERIPADLNPWAGAAVVALHNHTETDMCDDTCTTYGEGPTE